MLKLLLLVCIWNMSTTSAKDFDEYQKFQYSYKSSTESKIRMIKQKCMYTTSSTNQEGCLNLSMDNCLLKCISPKCFALIYAHNPLEEGEFDQRISSFKGCITADLDWRCSCKKIFSKKTKLHRVS